MRSRFKVTITGRYTASPEKTDGDVSVEWKSQRPEKRLAELAVLRALFTRWAAKTVEELSR